MNYRMITYIVGWILNIEGAFLLLPLIVAGVYREGAEAMSIALTMLMCLIIGFIITRFRPKNKVLYAKEGFVIVSLSWIVLSIFGMLPFLLSGAIPSVFDALFETVSGFTTTGATILTDVESLGKSLIFWRSFTHWLGGMGVLVFIMAILPLSGGNNMYIMKVESTGPSVGKLVPKVRDTAFILYAMYLGITILEVILLLTGGMSVFDSLTLSFGTVGTGGFGIVNSGAAEYSSYVQIVITVFMIMCGVNFSMYYLILKGKFKEFFKSTELRVYLSIIFIAIAIISINIKGMYDTTGEAVKHAAFQVGSIITTTGFATCDYNLWPELSKMILVILMFIGGCAGSTAGGMKVDRFVILFKTLVKELKVIVHPRCVKKVKVNGKTVEHEVIRSVNVYVFAFVLLFVGSLLVISLDGFDTTTNFTAVSATLNNIGPGLNMVGPTGNFSEFSNLSKLVFTFNMLAGRLELFPMLVFMMPSTWRKNR